MQLEQGTGSKQHILAEDCLGNGFIPSLSNLYIAHYTDCITLAVFSSKEKKLIAYKIINPIDNLHKAEQWLSEPFNRVTTVSFTHHFKVAPQLFSDNTFEGKNTIGDMIVEFLEDTPDSVHYITALVGHHLKKKERNQVYLYKHLRHYGVLLMNHEECLLANAFMCENENEVLYFVINALQISDILPSDATLNIDYSLYNDQAVVHFLSPHIARTQILSFSFEGINTSIPGLAEKLFACHAASLCV